MQIVIAKNTQTQLYDIFLVNDAKSELKIDDAAHSNLGLEEAKTRAAALKSPFACQVVRGDCDDYLLFKEI